MIKQKAVFFILGLVFLGIPPLWAEEIHHQLQVHLDPETHYLKVTDTITLPKSYTSPVAFRLHAHLNPRITSSGIRLQLLKQSEFIEDYTLEFPAQTHQLTLAYEGEIFHPIAPISEEYAHSFSASPGLISPEGVFLAGGSFWYPHFATDDLIDFSLTVQLPSEWRSVSQGMRAKRATDGEGTEEIWKIDHPQEEIYLLAGRFTEYQDKTGQVEAMVFLRQPDSALAHKYLAATGQYIDMYRQLIGPYPYGKFALVENFWETGYGMPSFTLLGPQVIRFPFILQSSYPHEILHNWWGNGVYVDYAHGNWSEGLTSYLADHLLKEQQHQGIEYRRETLQKYTDYVQGERDFPLTEFRGRHSAVTQAVGYGKTLMLFHMLRQQLGDSAFIKGLQQLYRQNLFQVTSFDGVEQVFNQVSNQSLAPFFKQWVDRTGAPFLQVHEAQVKPVEGKYLLTATIEQLQSGEAYQLELPLVIYLEGVSEAYQTWVSMTEKTYSLKLTLPARPLRLEVDPQFDLFRRLHRNEIPPALSQAFGADRALAILPSQAPAPIQEGYGKLIRQWQREGRNIKIMKDDSLAKLPTEQTVWLFGWENRFRSVFNESLAGYSYKAAEDSIDIEGNTLRRDEHSVVVTTRHRDNPDHAFAWVATDKVAAMPGLARKLPHYGKYSYLGFTGTDPENVIKGQWPVINSPMSIELIKDHAPIKAKLPVSKPLIALPPLFNAQRMVQDIAYLSDPKLAGRGLGTPELEQAADYIAREFQAAGLKPAVGGNYAQIWTQKINGLAQPVAIRNVVGVFLGTDFTLPAVVIGAHYDHLGRGWPDVHQEDEGKIHPGADDNASGIGVMLELARIMGPHWQSKRSVIFVAFTAEEAGRLGSIHYVQELGDHPEKSIMTMINLDTVGRLGSGHLLVLAANSAREWGAIFQGAGFVTGIPVDIAVNNIASTSDQASFLEVGIPAVQLFTGAHEDYHRPTDTVDKIDSTGLIKVASVLKEAVEYLTTRVEPLTSKKILAQQEDLNNKPQLLGRKITLGTIPDFTWARKGVRLSGVTPGTPADKAGLQKNDIIVGINNKAINTLTDLANVLRTLKEGDSVVISFLRGPQEQMVATHVIAR
ncbi:peptidase M28 [Candidatus Nitrosoglobus terrae]|uniref:Peptidase M28 n=1 Tax=Candidatus Nitrosoglobus terrae TaxID=1630141 RepID=A0A1Q2SLW6_9GAMM|nr:M20/M25/M40 family metallo-hydrolase [Candidatus Nitrosoglobus terrae]BAW80112.1 peptidase M28 [Candidatus Nitrosoglobus terrae]